MVPSRDRGEIGSDRADCKEEHDHGRHSVMWPPSGQHAGEPDDSHPDCASADGFQWNRESSPDIPPHDPIDVVPEHPIQVESQDLPECHQPSAPDCNAASGGNTSTLL